MNMRIAYISIYFVLASPCPIVAMPVDVGPVLKEWMECEAVVQRASVLKLMSVELGVSPNAAEAHTIIIAPVMKHLGFLFAHAASVLCMQLCLTLPLWIEPSFRPLSYRS